MRNTSVIMRNTSVIMRNITHQSANEGILEVGEGQLSPGPPFLCYTLCCMHVRARQDLAVVSSHGGGKLLTR